MLPWITALTLMILVLYALFNHWTLGRLNTWGEHHDQRKHPW